MTPTDPRPSGNGPTPGQESQITPRGLEQIVTFLREIDRLKRVQRRSYLMDGSRHENSAEHSWHIALMALVLAPFADEPIDVNRVVQMLLVHDLVEIDAGDTFAYDRPGRQAAAAREETAARRIFGLLPQETGAALYALWQEFEARQTPEARFAKAMDRLMPILHNFYTQGATWREHQVHLGQVVDLNRPIAQGSELLWRYVRGLLDEAVEAGYLAPAPHEHPGPSPNDAKP